MATKMNRGMSSPFVTVKDPKDGRPMFIDRAYYEKLTKRAAVKQNSTLAERIRLAVYKGIRKNKLREAIAVRHFEALNDEQRRSSSYPAVTDGHRVLWDGKLLSQDVFVRSVHGCSWYHLNR